MELDAVAVFVKVVEAGSFSGAARLLKMPNTTVSARVAALEKRLGVTLILRTTRKLHVTEAGRKYFQRCALALKSVEQAEAELQSDQATPQGLLRVTAPVDLSHSILPGIVSEYLKRYPHTELELIVSNRNVDLIGEGIDLAIRAGKLQDSTLMTRKFFEIRAALWAAPAYLKQYGTPGHPRELTRHRVIARAGMKSIDVTNGKVSAKILSSTRITVDDLETVKALAMLGEGIAWLPQFLVARERATGELVEVLPAWRIKGARAFSFVYPGQKYSSPKVRAFIETAIELTTEESGRG